MAGFRNMAAASALSPHPIHDQSDLSYLDFSFAADDVLLFGRESAGVSEAVHTAADARLLIPMRPDMRSLNVAIAAALAAGEALRQTRDNGSARHAASEPLRG
jgi:tRNA (cytidine/uridine-2'-O-)-methyltransferase